MITLSSVIFGCITVLCVSLLVVVARMIKGPTIMDRILCFDAMSVCVVGILLLLSVWWRSWSYLDLVLVFSLFGFLGTIVFSYYLYKTYIPHQNNEEVHDVSDDDD